MCVALVGGSHLELQIVERWRSTHIFGTTCILTVRAPLTAQLDLNCAHKQGVYHRIGPATSGATTVGGGVSAASDAPAVLAPCVSLNRCQLAP